MHYFQVRQLYLMLNAIERMKRQYRIKLVVQAAREMQQTRLTQRTAEISLFGIRDPREKR
jgi:hypothetical protein